MAESAARSLPGMTECAEAFIRGELERAKSALKRVPIYSSVGEYRVPHFTFQFECKNINDVFMWSLFTRFRVDLLGYREGSSSFPFLIDNVRNDVPLLHLAAHQGWVDVARDMLRTKAYHVDPLATIFEKCT